MGPMIAPGTENQEREQTTPEVKKKKTKQQTLRAATLYSNILLTTIHETVFAELKMGIKSQK